MHDSRSRIYIMVTKKTTNGNTNVATLREDKHLYIYNQHFDKVGNLRGMKTALGKFGEEAMEDKYEIKFKFAYFGQLMVFHKLKLNFFNNRAKKQ